MSGKINVVIQAIAGHAIGTGHFARGGAVANALCAYDDLEITIVTTQTAVGLVDVYFPCAVDMLALPDAEFGPQAVLKALTERGIAPNALYLDQYGVLSAWEEAAFAASLPLVAIDDLLEADTSDWIIRPIAGETPSSQINVLEGPAYLPLTADITNARSVEDAPVRKARRINICFGGSDPTGETLKALEAVSTLNWIEVDVVIGPRAQITETDLAQFEQLTHVWFHHAPTQKQTVKLLQSADLAIGAGGVMQWERLCIGVPSLVVTVADNQNQQVAWMVEQGAIRWLGDHRHVTSELIRDALVGLIDNQAARMEMSRRGTALVDGRGAMRIAAVVRAACFSVRPVVPDDARDLYDWRTHASNWQFNLYERERPDFGSHVVWLEGKLANPHCQFMIVLQGQEPIAVARFDIAADGCQASLSIYLVPQHHGRKLGLAVYFTAERELRKTHPSVVKVTSDIHAQNTASQRLHSDAGFSLLPADDPNWLVGLRSL
ncbi:MAG: GNAT family N-acetyltransferase [Yoonia sp.]|uniref:GNAT family N-acetyltransferase n=1 Tax=Yoonia sp. TaxID=2212373 RepID=UPI003EFA48CE